MEKLAIFPEIMDVIRIIKRLLGGML